MIAKKHTDYTATQNACKLCTPLGASLVLKGIENAVPILHGSQGCATYIRRYLISHFKEPVDIASSNFSEDTAVFGGSANLQLGIDNLRAQYKPDIIGIATTCLSETIGEDVTMILRDYRAAHPDQDLPAIINVSTPSYTGTHIDGFHSTVKSAVELLAHNGVESKHVNVMPGMLSPADIRYLKTMLTDFGLSYVMLPDYSETLDGGLWDEYQHIQSGGTKVVEIESMGCAQASLEFGRVLATQSSAGKTLAKKFNVPCHSLGTPIGIRETDQLLDTLEEITGRPTPAHYHRERGRLLDAYVDGHKYVSQKRAVVYGEEDLVIGLVSFLREIGIIPVICASGGESGLMEEKLRAIVPDFDALGMSVWDGVDFVEITELAEKCQPDFLIGNSKGFSVARQINVPLVRVGFPIHDRLGGSRVLHIGYAGAQQLFDKVANVLIEAKQEATGVGYSYM
ncbi:MAG TPA: nitrogenase component 1 [Anaerolineae bacterium]|nr:nitrogenase [Anaerolineae bacterium]MCB0225976.1 nitrogenase [Anaerolineae bacterium]HRV93678.1 nitrogenase component 1 [Anaerolineae bacterium]